MSHEICEEMKKLREELTKRQIEWSDWSEVYKVNPEDQGEYIDRTKIFVKGEEISIINGFGTYGGYDSFDGESGNDGLLELMVGNFEPIGWLKADKCLELIEKFLKVEDDEHNKDARK